MKITLTGSSGFIGKKILSSELLNTEGNEVFTLRYQKGAERPYSPTTQQLKETKVLVHCGASTPKNNIEANDLTSATSNVVSTSELLQLNWEKLEKIVYLSTLDVYSHGGEISEETSPLPMTNYGWSKYISEAFIRSFCREKQITFTIIRLGNLYGPGEEAYQKVIPAFIRSALQGKDLVLSTNGEESRSFLYIDDAVNMITELVVGNLLEDSVINLIGEYPCTISVLAEHIISLTDTNARVIRSSNQKTGISHKFNIAKMKYFFPAPQIALRYGLEKEIQQFKL